MREKIPQVKMPPCLVDFHPIIAPIEQLVLYAPFFFQTQSIRRHLRRRRNFPADIYRLQMPGRRFQNEVSAMRISVRAPEAVKRADNLRRFLSVIFVKLRRGFLQIMPFNIFLQEK